MLLLSHSSGITNLFPEDYENTSDLLTQIALEMKYEYQGSNSLLFKRGDIGENFYLLIKMKSSCSSSRGKKYLPISRRVYGLLD